LIEPTKPDAASTFKYVYFDPSKVSISPRSLQFEAVGTGTVNFRRNSDSRHRRHVSQVRNTRGNQIFDSE